MIISLCSEFTAGLLALWCYLWAPSFGFSFLTGFIFVTFKGEPLPLSSGNEITIKFTTEGPNTAKGFHFVYQGIASFTALRVWLWSRCVRNFSALLNVTRQRWVFLQLYYIFSVVPETGFTFWGTLSFDVCFVLFKPKNIHHLYVYYTVTTAETAQGIIPIR